MNKYLIEMADGGIIDICDDMECDDYGCPTCGFNGHYTNHMEITLEKNILEIEFGGMYTFDVPNYSDIMKIFTQNNDNIKDMTEEEFVEFLKEELDNLTCYEIEMSRKEKIYKKDKEIW